MLRFLSCAAVALATLQATPSAFGNPREPYRAFEVGKITSVVPSLQGAHVEADLSGYGTVTGAYTGTLSYEVTVDPVTNIRSFTAKALIKTTDGAELFGEATGRNDEPVPPFIYTGTFRINGGTGRFQNAKAAGRFVGYDAAQGEFTTFYDGELLRPGCDGSATD